MSPQTFSTMKGAQIMTRLVKIFAVSAAALLFASAPALAQDAGAAGPGGWRGSPHGRSPLASLVRGAGLSDPQREQVRQIVAAHRDQFRNLAGQLRQAQQALRDKLYGADAVTAVDLAPLTQQIDLLRGQLTQESLQVALEVRGVLTPDQLAKVAARESRLRDLRAEMRSLMSGR
jgi:Spy/CpxP family protein refolding chaperone